MKAGAPIGNKNAEKWTIEESEDLIDRAIDLCDEEDSRVIKVQGLNTKIQFKKYDFLGEIASELGVYRDLISRDLPKRFPHLQTKVNLLKGRLESNCYSNTKKEAINTATGIVNLKSNHNWTDRNNVDHTNKGESFKGFSFLNGIDGSE